MWYKYHVLAKWPEYAINSIYWPLTLSRWHFEKLPTAADFSWTKLATGAADYEKRLQAHIMHTNRSRYIRRQTDRQTNSQADRQTDRRKDGRIDGQTDGHTDRHCSEIYIRWINILWFYAYFHGYSNTIIMKMKAINTFVMKRCLCHHKSTFMIEQLRECQDVYW